MKLRPENHWWLVGTILAVAAVLRLYALDFSFSNDELSALTRLNYPTFSALINQGIRVDGHPAFTQLLLFCWTHIAGLSEVAVRLPFVIFGIGAVLMLFLTCRDWFGTPGALFASACMAGLQFFIMYSQLARPYSPGLFFTCATAFFWGRILLNKGGVWNAVLAGVCTALAMLTHYFSFMQVMLMAVLGLFLINRQSWKHYLIAAITALAIWIPHFEITRYQLSLGGVGLWLGPPEPDFIWQFLRYVFNDHYLLITFIIALAILGFFLRLPAVKFSKWQLICLLLLILPYGIGYYYSVHINPVMQFSTLLFAAPFLLMLVFSFFPTSLSKWMTITITVLLLCVTSLSTMLVARYYATEQFGVFRELSEKIKAWDEQYGRNNVAKVAHLNSPDYLHHYFEKLGHRVETPLWSIDNDSTRAALRHFLQHAEEPFLAFAWSNRYVPPETYEIIRFEYPQRIEHANHFNSGAYLFSKAGKDERKPSFSFEVDFKKSPSQFIPEMDTEKIIDENDTVSYRMTSDDEYAFNFVASSEDLNLRPGDLLTVICRLHTSYQTNCTLVLEVSSDFSADFWKGNNLYPGFNSGDSNHHDMILVYEVPEENNEDDRVKIYLWKQSAEELRITNFEVRVFPSGD